MYKVRKRNGKIVSFDLTKITEVIKKAFEAESVNYTDDIIDFLALKVTAEFSSKIEDNTESEIEKSSEDITKNETTEEE